jgi:hypothetical protein
VLVASSVGLGVAVGSGVRDEVGRGVAGGEIVVAATV